MTYLRSGEGNLISLDLPYDTPYCSVEIDKEAFVKRFTDEFGKWGRIQREDLDNVYNGKSLNMKIHDVDPDSSESLLTEGWLGSFQKLSAEFSVNVTVAWIPYVNALEDARIWHIESGKLYPPRSLTW